MKSVENPTFCYRAIQEHPWDKKSKIKEVQTASANFPVMQNIISSKLVL